jgi:sugar transferase (PEP-CTERM system associated)
MLVRVLRHYVPASLLALAALEASIFFFTVYLATAVRFGAVQGSPELAAQVFPLFPKAAAFAIVMLGAMTAFGLYDRESQEHSFGYYVRCAGGFAAGTLVIMVVFYAVPTLALGRGVFVLAVVLAFAGHMAARVLCLRLVDTDAFKRRILVVGTGRRAARVAELERLNGCGDRFHVVGYLPVNGSHNDVDSRLVLREQGSLQSIAQKHRIDEIIVGVRERRNGNVPIIDLLERKIGGTNVIDLPTFFERETGRVQLDSVDPSWFVFSDGFRNGGLHRLLKRSFDICLTGVLLLVTLPLMLLTALAIWLESGGPLLYRQDRIGVGGHSFELLKFRSMRTDAEPDGAPRWAQPNDDRCTRVGRIMRRLRLDELPQLINVLLGEMSFVGPRPERPAFVAQLSKDLKYYVYRHAVKPGLTGWAQICYPYGASVEDAKEKLQYDLYYIKNQSLFLDLVIFAQTAHIVLFGKGAR